MEKVIYSKCSTERKREYKILTCILERDGQKIVQKKAANEVSNEHVNRMLEYYQSGECYCLADVKNAPCMKSTDGCIEFEFIEGISYSERMENFAELGDVAGLENCVMELRDIIINVSGVEQFSTSAEFENLFGKHERLSNLNAAKGMNIDLLAENIILSSKTRYVIDYEWTFPFAIPLKYIVFRMLFFNSTISSLDEIEKKKIYTMCDISSNEWDTFYDMELRFQSYLSGNSLDEVKKRIGMKTYLFSQNNELIPSMRYFLSSEHNLKLLDGELFGSDLKINLNVLDCESVFLNLDCEMCSVKIVSTDARLLSSNESMMIGEDRFFLNKPCFKFDVTEIDVFDIYVQILNQGNALIQILASYCKKEKELEEGLLKSGDKIADLLKRNDELTKEILQLGDQRIGYVGKIDELTRTVLQLGNQRTEYVGKIDELTQTVLQLGNQRNDYLSLIGKLDEEKISLKNSILELEERFNRYSERSNNTISELGYELSKIKSAKNFEKFAKKNKLYEG